MVYGQIWISLWGSMPDSLHRNRIGTQTKVSQETVWFQSGCNGNRIAGQLVGEGAVPEADVPKGQRRGGEGMTKHQMDLQSV